MFRSCGLMSFVCVCLYVFVFVLFSPLYPFLVLLYLTLFLLRMRIIYLYIYLYTFIYMGLLILSSCLSFYCPSSNTSLLNSVLSRTNSGTSTTNVTQTRVTHRPHVHVTPLNVPGMGMNQFDPFLPCQSHHIRPATRRRHQAQTQVGWLDMLFDVLVENFLVSVLVTEVDLHYGCVCYLFMYSSCV